MITRKLAVCAVLPLLLLGAPSALLAKEAAAPTRANADAVPVASQPQQTSASFGDWVVRCQRLAEAAHNEGKARETRVCEAAQALLVKGQQAPIAQIAFAPSTKGSSSTAREGGEPSQSITVLLPTNIAFDKPAEIGFGDAHLVTLAYRRCVPGGCLADAKVDGATLHQFRTATKPGELVFTDAGERTLKLPFSPHGLAPALDDLAKEAQE